MRKLLLFWILLCILPFTNAQLVQHLDASIDESIVLDASGNVTEWIDQSGAGNNALPSTGNVIVSNENPRWLYFGADNNSLELFSSEESDLWLDQSSATADGFCVMIAFKVNELLPDNINDLIGNSTSTGSGYAMRYKNNGSMQAYLGGYPVSTGSTTVSINDSVVLAFNYNASEGIYEYWDSKQQVLISGDIPPADFSLSNPVKIGMTSGDGRYIDGFIGEVKVFGSVLSQSEFKTVRESMAEKWVGYEPPLELNWHLVPADDKYPSDDIILAAVSVDDPRLHNPLPADPSNIDCSATFQEAIDLVNINGGGTVFVPEGEYRFDNNLELMSGVTLRGRWDIPSEAGWNTGSVMKVYYGKNQPDADAFINTVESSNTGVMNLTFWYPEQTQDNVTAYPYTIAQAFTIEDITLVNAYRGICELEGAMRLVRGVYGSPLENGLIADKGTAVPRWNSIYFNPQYWEWWPLDDVTANREQPGNYAYFMFNHGTGIRLWEQDTYTFFNIEISGYETGYMMEDNSGGSTDGDKSPNQGHASHVNIHDCKKAIHIKQGSFSTGLKSNFSGTEYGIYATGGGELPLIESTISGGIKAVYCTGSSFTLNLIKCEINGELDFDNGTVKLKACNFTESGTHLSVSSVANGIVQGCTYNNSSQITIVGEQNLDIVDHSEFHYVPLPDYGLNKLTDWNTTRKPAKQGLFNVKDYGASGNGVDDDTPAISDALNAAKTNGGGIVFFPFGTYRLLDNLELGEGIELRGIAGSRIRISDKSAIDKGVSVILVEKAGPAQGTPLISMGDYSGVRGLCFFYPGNNWDRVLNGGEEFSPYPYTIYGSGLYNYVINCTNPNAYNFIDFDGATEPLAELNLIGGLHNVYRVRGGSTSARIQTGHVKPAAFWGVFPDLQNVKSNFERIRPITASMLEIFDFDDCSDVTVDGIFGRAANKLLTCDGASGRAVGVAGEELQNGFGFESSGADPFYMIDTKPNPGRVGDSTGQTAIFLDPSFPDSDTVYALGGKDQGSADYKFKVHSGNLYVQGRRINDAGKRNPREIFVDGTGNLILNDVYISNRITIQVKDSASLKMNNCNFSKGMPYTQFDGSVEIGKNCIVNGNYIISAPGQWQFTEQGIVMDRTNTRRLEAQRSYGQQKVSGSSFNFDVTEPAYQDGNISNITFELTYYILGSCEIKVYYQSNSGEKLGTTKSYSSASGDKTSNISFSVSDANFSSDVDVRIETNENCMLSSITCVGNPVFEAPTKLSAADGKQIMLDWSGKTHYQFDSYNLYRSENSGGPYDKLDSTVKHTDYLDTDVNDGTTYYYIVRAVKTDGTESGNSNEAFATAGSVQGGDILPPLAPANLIANPGEEAISLDWEDNTEADLKGYNVYRSTSQGLGYFQVNQQPVIISAFTDSNVVEEVTYYYVVEAYDRSSNVSKYSNEVSAELMEAQEIDLTAPENPTGLTAMEGDSIIVLDWNDNLEQDLESYNVYRSSTQGNEYTRINEDDLFASVYIDSSVNMDVNYYYVVTAVDTAGNESGFSNEVLGFLESEISHVNAKPLGSDIILYPNPTKGLLFFRGQEIQHIKLFRLDGALLMEKDISRNQLYLNMMRSGSYIIQLSWEDSSSIRRIINVL